WAGAILTGKVAAFKFTHSLPWLRIIILLIVLLGITFLTRKSLIKTKTKRNSKSGIYSKKIT
ncbi:MAG: hypothetical protein ABI184_03940, partial [Ginsengibacter sp.]